jgi:hypothetical protein
VNLSEAFDRLKQSLSGDQKAAEERITQAVRDYSRLNEEALTRMVRRAEFSQALSWRAYAVVRR